MARDLLEVEFLLVYQLKIDPNTLKGMDFGEVMFLSSRLKQQMDEEKKANGQG